MDKTIDIYNEFVHEYLSNRLYPGEHIVIGKFEKEWASFKMLDIGIGAGRTTHHFSPITKHYTGVDYAEGMLSHCRRSIPEKHNTTLLHCDARDLSRFYKEKFDFVMFSMGGIDSVGLKERLKILSEIKKVLSKDGYFFFATHSTRAFKNSRAYSRFKWHSPAESVYHLFKTMRFNRKIKSLYSDNDVTEIQKCDWKILKTGDHNFKVDVFHINPVVQIKQLNDNGFHVESIYGLDGGIADPETTQANMLCYLCKLKSGEDRDGFYHNFAK